MTKVMATGVFDILHLGHINYLNQSKALGEDLVVVVATDLNAQKSGKKLVFSESARREMVSNLKMVDEAIVGNHGDIFKTVELLKPDIITLGFDQKFDEKQIKEECAKRNIKVRVVRCKKFDSTDPVGTRMIKRKIVEMEGIRA